MRFFSLVLLGSALVGTAACGGKVVVEGSSANVGGAGGTISSSSSSPSTGSGLDVSFCGQVCKSLAASGCTGDDCVARCEGTFNATPECYEGAKAAVFCIADHAADSPGCSSPACDGLMTTFEGCTSASQCEKAVVGATGTTPGCVGKGVCGGDEWAATCDDTGLCQCNINNDVVGACQETGPFLCDFRRGCCGALFPSGG